MIVIRVTHRAKMGHGSELIELLKGWLENEGRSGRVYSSRNTWDTVSLDVEFESDEDINKWRAGWNPPGDRPFMKKLNALRELGSTWETLEVH